MDFAALVLMEVDKDNKFVDELGSYEVREGAEYVTKFFFSQEDERVHLYFDTKKDVEEWEYTAIYELFNEEVFEGKGYEIEEKDDEYNPTWLIKFDYIEEHMDMAEKLNEVCGIINEELNRVFKEAEMKKSEYMYRK